MAADASEIQRYFAQWRKETDAQLKAIVILISGLRTDLQHLRTREKNLRYQNTLLKKELRTVHELLETETKANFPAIPGGKKGPKTYG